jgi:hypothetical protein
LQGHGIFEFLHTQKGESSGEPRRMQTLQKRLNDTSQSTSFLL